MNLTRLVFILFRAAVLGILVALPLSGDEFISAKVWVAATAVLATTALLVDVVTKAALQPATINLAFTWHLTEPRQHGNHYLRELRSIQATLASAQHNDRSFVNRLRPRLEALAEHFLPIRQAVDPKLHPAKAQALLGDVAWLIDPAVTSRSPTIGEISKFLDLVMAEEVMPAETQQHLSETEKSDGRSQFR